MPVFELPCLVDARFRPSEPTLPCTAIQKPELKGERQQDHLGQTLVWEVAQQQGMHLGLLLLLLLLLLLVLLLLMLLLMLLLLLMMMLL